MPYFFCLTSLHPHAIAQNAAACPVQPPQIVPSVENIFNLQQEEYLGEVIAELKEPYMTILPPIGNDDVTRVGEKLLAQLPPTSQHFTFQVYESDELNAFSTTGGHIYISRKLITYMKNEDM